MPNPTAKRFSDWRRFLPLALIAAASLVAWSNSFAGAFVYDDVPAVTRNPSLQQLWPPWKPFFVGRSDLTVSGRPLANWTLAVNRALGGERVAGYHAVNLILHTVAAFALFGIVRRTLRRVPIAENLAPHATSLATLTALLWLVHPLQTESVTYVIQRVEALMGACFLLTLYGFLRSTESAATRTRWQIFAVLACLAGMASKEVMVTAPIVVLLFDRTFVAGTFMRAWRERRWFYSSLAASWLPLAALVVSTGDRSGSAGFGGAVSWWEYARLQVWAVSHYLRLAVWPSPLIFDYGLLEPDELGWLWLRGLFLATLVLAAAIGVWRRTATGFLGACFFIILAPSSSVLPIGTEPVAEHRMYLPLAALVVLTVLALERMVKLRGTLIVGGLLVPALAAVTLARNNDYRDAITLWTATAEKMPGNARAQNNLGSLLLERGDVAGALKRFSRAIELQPYYASAHYNLGCALMRSGRAEESLPHFTQAIAIEPDFADAYVNFGEALLALSRPAEAARELEAAAKLQPRAPDIHASLGRAYQSAGRIDAALRELRAAVVLAPDDAALRFSLGNLLARAGDGPAAVGEFQRARALAPTDLRIANNLANAQLLVGRFEEAIAGYQAILAAEPDNRSVQENLQQAQALLREKSARP